MCAALPNAKFAGLQVGGAVHIGALSPREFGVIGYLNVALPAYVRHEHTPNSRWPLECKHSPYTRMFGLHLCL